MRELLQALGVVTVTLAIISTLFWLAVRVTKWVDQDAEKAD